MSILNCDCLTEDALKLPRQLLGGHQQVFSGPDQRHGACVFASVRSETFATNNPIALAASGDLAAQAPTGERFSLGAHASR